MRQLCDAYWASAKLVVSDNGRYGDIELKITGLHGPTSWDAVVVSSRDLPANYPALLRFQKHEEFEKGTRLRVLDATISRESENYGAPVIVTLGILSEAYQEAPANHNRFLGS